MQGGATQAGRLVRIAAAIVVAGGAAQAHDLWIEPERFSLPAAEPAVVRIMIGHTAERAPWSVEPRRIRAFRAMSAQGSTDWRAALARGGAEGPAALALDPVGLHVLALESAPARIELPGPLFEAYIVDNGLVAPQRLRQKTRMTDAPGRETYSRRAKALIASGPRRPSDAALAVTPLGLTLEITPLVDPFDRDASKALPLSVRFRGEPLDGALVRLSSLDLPISYITAKRSDAAGEVSFVLPRVGAWLFTVAWSTPAQGDADADFETVFSSLTLGYDARP